MIIVSKSISFNCAHIRGGCSGRGRQTTAGLSMPTVFGYFGGYFFGNYIIIISYRSP